MVLARILAVVLGEPVEVLLVVLGYYSFEFAVVVLAPADYCLG